MMTNEELIAADRQAEIDHERKILAEIETNKATLASLTANGKGQSTAANLMRAVIAELRYDLPSEQRRRAWRERMSQ